MKKIAALYGLILCLVTPGAAPAAQRGPHAPKFSVTTRLDKTALWVGDRLTYTIQVIHDRDVEFVLDHLKKENLSFAPFVIRDLSLRQGEWAGGKRTLEITFILSAYEVGRTELTIPSLNLYYFSRESEIGKREHQAEVARVPAMKVGLRSTLSGGQLWPRDFKPAPTGGIGHGLLALLLGLAGMIFLAIYGARQAWMALRTEKEKKSGLSPQAREKLVQEGLARIRALRGESPEDLIRFYTEVSHFLRLYLSQWLEIEAASLTPEEIEVALGKAHMNGSMAQEIRTALEQCDAVRYGRNGLKLGVDFRARVLEAVERILRPQHT